MYVLLLTLETPLESPAHACPTWTRFHATVEEHDFSVWAKNYPTPQRILLLLTSVCAALQPHNYTGLVAHLRPTTNPHNHHGCQLRTKTPCYYNPPQEWGGGTESSFMVVEDGYFHTVDIFEKIQFGSFRVLFSSKNRRSQDEQKRFFFFSFFFADCTFLSESRRAEHETPTGSLILRC